MLKSIAILVAFIIPSTFFSSAFGAYKVIDVIDGGSISGRVSFEGPLPRESVEKIDVVKNMDICGEGKREVVWIDVENGALRDTFVFIDRIEAGKKWADQGAGYLLDQKNCRFKPWVQVVNRGPLTIRNSDEGILHNVNVREIIGVEKGRTVKRTLFNIGQPEKGEMSMELKPRRSPYIAVTCEAHNFMFGFILSPEHPYAVVVKEDGSFLIDDVPPGTYIVKTWHPKLGVKSASVTVKNKEKSLIDFAFSK